MPALITISQFQAEYAVSRSTVIRMHKKGLLPLIKIGRSVRIRREDADSWFASLPGNSSATSAGS